MPSWLDGESGDSYGFLNGGSDSDIDGEYSSQLTFHFPATIDSETWCGMDMETKFKCGCAWPPQRFVAFEGEDAGRRFLACSAEDEIRCRWMRFVDPEWSPELRKVLRELWDRGMTKEDCFDEMCEIWAQGEEEKFKMKMQHADHIEQMEKAHTEMMNHVKAQLAAKMNYEIVIFGFVGTVALAIFQAVVNLF